jgi:hypothetical protein
VLDIFNWEECVTDVVPLLFLFASRLHFTEMDRRFHKTLSEKVMQKIPKRQ